MALKVSHLTVGLDIGDKMSAFCVLDSHRAILEEGFVGTTPKELEAFFRRFAGSILVFEVGTHSPWIQRLARKCGFERVINADPRQLALISASQSKTDRGDAYILAMSGRGMPELLNPVEHRSEQSQADRSLLSSRAALIRARTSLINQIRGQVKSAGGRITGVSTTYFFSRAEEQIPQILKPAIAPLLEVLRKIHEELVKIERIEKEMARDKYPITELLRTVPSIGLQTALSFVLTIEDPARIRGTRQVGAYLGMTPRKKESGKAAPQLGITKAGDREMRRLLVQCAHHLLARGKDCRLRRWGLEMCRRGGPNARKRAIVAVARKLSVLLLSIWRSGKAYDPWRGVPESERPVIETPVERTNIALTA